MHFLVEKTFKQHGFNPDYLNKIEDPSHSNLDNMGLMCYKLYEAYLNKSHIVLIPDFDMDGISAGTLGYAGMCELGFYISLYLPNVSNGYGFGKEDIDAIMQAYPDTKIIMTCDVGISCIEGIKYAKSLGLTVFVTDHHVGTYDNGADITVDPSAMGSTYSNTLGKNKICGAFVLWQILRAYAYEHGTYDQIDAIERLIVFVGIGTISDTMPILCENRVAVKSATGILKWLTPNDDVLEEYDSFDEYASVCSSGYHNLGTTEQYKNTFYGLQALMWYFASQKYHNASKIDEDFFGFTIAPMFNSVKRMNSDINYAFGIFFDRANAYENIKKLFDLNMQRKQIVADAMLQLADIPQPFKPFIYLSDAQPGILGLLATQIFKMTNLPTIVLSRTAFDDGMLHGSGRSPESYNFMSAVKRLNLSDKMTVAGHAAAFGVTALADEDALSAIYMAIYTDTLSYANDLSNTNPLDESDFIIGTDATSDITFDVFTLYDYFNEINSYKPFGNGFFKPNIGLKITKDDMKHFKWFITGAKSQHAKFSHADGLEIVIWDGAGDTYFCKDGFTALGHLQILNTDGHYSLSFIVDSLLETSESDGASGGDTDAKTV